MSANAPEAAAKPDAAVAAPLVPKRITNAQTVCNERNEKNKLCNGHLKQLKTAGEPSEVHLRGDDVLFKCQICGTLYMGPPLGHVRDPEKQHRFVEAELAAVLQAAGGTLPVIKKNARGVYVIVEAEGAGHGHAAPTPAAAKPTPTAVPKQPTASEAKATAVAEKLTAAPQLIKPAGEPNRSLNRRSTYAGFKDSGPVAGETREQKIARLAQLVEAVKKRTDEGGGPEYAAANTVVGSTAEADALPQAAEAQATRDAPSAAPATQPAPATSHAPTGELDRNLMRRGTYAGVADTGPVAGETHEQKIERLAKLVEAVKRRTMEG